MTKNTNNKKKRSKHKMSQQHLLIDLTSLASFIQLAESDVTHNRMVDICDISHRTVSFVSIAIMYIKDGHGNLKFVEECLKQ